MNYFILIIFLAGLLPAPLFADETISAPQSIRPPPTLNYETIEDEAATFFGEASAGLAKALEETFKERGQPSAYIKGQEFVLAANFAVRYGHGIMTVPGQEDAYPIFWQGPSIGFDQGINWSKVFILAYNLPHPENIFRGFPGVETSLYYYAGISATYLESNQIVLIPIRMGMGLRSGINIGYIRFSRAPSWNPF